MICKYCGTESTGKTCSHCGRSLLDPPVSVTSQKSEPTEEKQPEAHEEKKQKKKPYRLRFSRILLPTLSLFLPLVYFFTDVYTRLADVLFTSDAAGKSLISVLVDRLSSAEYGMNTMQELQVITLGSDAPLYRAISFAGRAEAGELLIPLWIVLGFSIASAVMGVLLLFSGGKILNSRATDLVVLAGVGASFSPLCGLLYLRLYYFFQGGLATADAAMRMYTLSVESVLMIGLSICMILPSVAALRREAAALRNSRVYVLTPWHRIGGRSFNLTRLIAMALIGACAFLGLLQMFLPILPMGHLFKMGTAWESIAADFKTFASSLWALLSAQAAEANFATLTATLMDLVFVFLGPCIIFSLLFLFFSFWSVFLARRRNLCEKRGKCRSICKVGRRLRFLYLLPYWCYTAAQIFLVVVLLFGTKIVFHVDMGAVSGTMSLVYMLIGYVKELCSTNTLYAILGCVGALLWHSAQNVSCRLIDLSCHSNGMD